jgi:hypothetical protein
MIFVCLLEARLPSLAESVSILLIVIGVGWGLRATAKKTEIRSTDRDRVIQ